MNTQRGFWSTYNTQLFTHNDDCITIILISIYTNKRVGSCHQFFSLSLVIVTCKRHGPFAGPSQFLFVATCITYVSAWKSALINADPDADALFPNLCGSSVFADADVNIRNIPGRNRRRDLWWQIDFCDMGWDSGMIVRGISVPWITRVQSIL